MEAMIVGLLFIIVVFVITFLAFHVQSEKKEKEIEILRKELDSYQESNDHLNIRIGNLQEKIHENTSIIEERTQTNTQLEINLEEEQEKSARILSQKKSSECKLGKISENLVPFLSKCPYSPSDMVFLGMPLDYLVFDLDMGEIIFLEIKSGNSRPSKKQRMLRDLIKAGNVFYEEMRIGTKGVKIKREKNNA